MAQQPIELILFRQLATSLAVPVFLVDADGDIVFLNEAAERVLGVRSRTSTRCPFEQWTTAFRPRRRRRADAGRGAARSSRPSPSAGRRTAPLMIDGTDGVERTIEVTAFPLEGGRGRLLGAVAMFWERRRRR